MAGTRKLSRTTSHRMAMLKNMTTSLILNGKIQTTEARAKEVKAIVDSLIDLAVREKDNFETKEKLVSRAKVDKNGKKVKTTKTSKNGNKYEVIERETVKQEVKVDKPSRLSARRKMFKYIDKIKDGKGNTIDLTKKLFEEIAPKYETKKGGYTRIIKLVPRRGDSAEMAQLEIL